MRQSIVVGVNSLLGMYCKGAVHKMGHNILVGLVDVVFVIGQQHSFQMCVVPSDETRSCRKSGTHHRLLLLKNSTFYSTSE